jgi:hypothetical protein
MEATGETGIHRLSRTPVGVALETTGPPVLNPAAAGVLLRILLRAAERNDITNATPADARPVRSDS